MENINHAKKRTNEDFAPTLPLDDIVCKSCLFRKPDFIINGKVIVKGCKNGYCDIYPNGKPNAILFSNAECEYYEPEE
jgi:hypothetical protein